MKIGTEEEKLRILLEHWIRHSKEHEKKLVEKAKELKKLGLTSAEKEIVLSAKSMKDATEHLRKALEELKR